MLFVYRGRGGGSTTWYSLSRYHAYAQTAKTLCTCL